MEHLDELAIYLTSSEHLCTFGIQNKARSDSSSSVSIRKEDRNDMWLARISSLESVVGVSLMPSSFIKQYR